VTADAVLVVVSRRLAGRPVVRHGPDHVAHRLRRLGLTTPGAVVLVGAAAFGSVLVGVLVHVGWLAPVRALWVAGALLPAVLGLLCVRVYVPRRPGGPPTTGARTAGAGVHTTRTGTARTAAHRAGAGRLEAPRRPGGRGRRGWAPSARRGRRCAPAVRVGPERPAPPGRGAHPGGTLARGHARPARHRVRPARSGGAAGAAALVPDRAAGRGCGAGAGRGGAGDAGPPPPGSGPLRPAVVPVTVVPVTGAVRRQRQPAGGEMPYGSGTGGVPYGHGNWWGAVRPRELSELSLRWSPGLRSSARCCGRAFDKS
jgi:hypothetical protein